MRQGLRLAAIGMAVAAAGACGRTELDPGTTIEIQRADASATRDAPIDLDLGPPDADGVACTVGDTVACTGPSGCQGTSTCTQDSLPGPCYCRADCTPGTTKIYLLSQSNVLFTFDPPSLALVEVGPLSCAIAPSSMAIDRHGTAWVHALDDRLFQVNILTAACTPIAYVEDQPGLGVFGMGFAANALGSADETLYVGAAAGLGKLDMRTLHISLIGRWILGQTELAGTADARLFGFNNSGRLMEIDPKSAAVLSSVALPGIGSFASFAMAAWGGDFWLFTDSRVTRYRPSDGSIEQVVGDLGVVILGAGVSTCASSR